MHKSQIPKDYKNQRYLTVDDAKIYYQVSGNLIKDTAKTAGAWIHIGSRVRIDKVKLDTYLEAQSEGSDSDET